MQNRFRFKVYYKPHNKVYNVICLNCDRQKEIIIEYNGSTALVEWENCIILQSTGLSDKNGKLIYEGDIIEFTDNVTINGSKTHAAKVEHNKEFNAYMYHADCIGWYTINPSQNKRFKVKVISNVYANPELLGVENER